MALLAIGLNHKTASIEVREKIYFSENEIKEILKDVQELPYIDEAAILSTCNRTEIYCETKDNTSKEKLSNWLLSHKGFSEKEIHKKFYSYTEDDVVRHALSVASGLDSMVIGEPQILGQFKNAYKQANDSGSIGKNLDRLFQFALSTAKEVRTDTRIGSNSLSIANIAVSLTDEFFGDLRKKHALLIGSGETIFISAKKLFQKGIGHITIANRNISKAQEIAKQVAGRAVHLSYISRCLEDTDILITATASNLPVIGKGAVETCMKKRKHKPIYMVDLAVPRDIEHEVKEIPNTYLYSLDNIQELIEKNYNTRRLAATDAKSIIDLRVKEYMSWRKAQTAFSVIRMYRNHCEEIKNEALKKALKQIKSGKDPVEVVTQLSSNITSKLSHEPTQALNKAGQTDDRKIISLICDIFLKQKQ
ncbi:MAG: glutamyl-tRNA reductase [Pseudomonadota bacterium]|nr:glutamyl-tRNA reductase [Pseudomonadota bacterium]